MVLITIIWFGLVLSVLDLVMLCFSLMIVSFVSFLETPDCTYSIQFNILLPVFSLGVFIFNCWNCGKSFLSLYTITFLGPVV